MADHGASHSSALSRVAHAVGAAFWLCFRVPATIVAFLLQASEAAGGRLRAGPGGLGADGLERLEDEVTPVRTLAAVCAAAAIALGASQFTDYSGVAVGAPGYSGEVEAVAPAPQTAIETAGSAHLYVLVPLAALALGLVWLTAGGRWRLGRAVAAIGLAGIVISLAVDLPQGLDAGRAGSDYLGTEARLLEGFWAQLAASATLLLAGPLLGAYARAAGGTAPYRRRRRLRPRRIGRRRPAAPRAEARA